MWVDLDAIQSVSDVHRTFANCPCFEIATVFRDAPLIVWQSHRRDDDWQVPELFDAHAKLLNAWAGIETEQKEDAHD